LQVDRESDRSQAEALEERHQSSSTRRNIGIVLDEILGRVIRCKFRVASFDHFSPPVENKGEVLFFCGGHGGDLFPAGEMPRLQRLTECREEGNEKQWKSDRYAQRLRPR